MIREIITTSGSFYTLQLPDDMIGKTVEVIAFEIERSGLPIVKSRESKAREIQAITQKSLTDLSKFKFNRDDANNYEA
jgi:hypothetical protein